MQMHTHTYAHTHTHTLFTFTPPSERGKKTRRTKKEVGRQHQRMDRPGDRQVPEGSGEQGKM